ncbi:MAG TPA: hypothetical protein VK034_26325, partial [Enhygromyxa sp.]|nr:hypothetical protein [Enhygromyxa sp.]
MSVANPAGAPAWAPPRAANDGEIPQAALASIARALQNILERYSGSAVRRVVGVADEYGIDGLYVAVIVMRERTAWPAMRSEDRNALELASRLMSGFAMLPSTTYMQV